MMTMMMVARWECDHQVGDEIQASRNGVEDGNNNSDKNNNVLSLIDEGRVEKQIEVLLGAPVHF